ncbi:hypothetical protein T03_8005 [Trichinella britovi]|uniref:G-protein coupled receptors family 1 profile domain-containing protein n=2 Tax=Trichinella TaxID=6333 RepID=A0A0V1D3T1_TRIBR|nr:hypothetical protein T05_4013 [Trichinella murrelli]KRX66031.1 hypothetical protein T09_15795 [Trichinella sp. T9]KRX76863.1 hypothetical protein T06_3425 [Trichinella sp. T6]KRY56129.1 hypothetical protein T03_8005 [Trichinella britovi]
MIPNETYQNDTSEFKNSIQIDLQYCLAIFGTLASVINFIFLCFLKKTISIKNKKFVFAYSFGCMLTGTGFAVANADRIRLANKSEEILPIYCFLKIYTYCFIVGESLISIQCFVMAVERFMAVKMAINLKKVPERIKNALLWGSIILCIFDLCSAIASSAPLTDKVNSTCYYRVSVSKTYFLLRYSICIILGYSSFALYVVVAVILRVNRSSVNSIRISQLRREASVMRHLFIIVFIIVFVQNLPITLNLLAVIFQPSLFIIPEIIWTPYAFALMIYALYCFGVHFCRRNNLVFTSSNNVNTQVINMQDLDGILFNFDEVHHKMETISHD